METKKFEINVKDVAVGAGKVVVGTAASVGAYIVIKKLLKGSVNPDAKTIEKIVTAVGVAALAAAAGEVAQNQVEKDIDMVAKTADTISKAFDKFAGKEAEAAGTDDKEKEN